MTTSSFSVSGIFAICCDLTRPTITRLARTFQSTRTRRRREQYMPLVASCLRHFLADFIICMCEFDFRQAGPRALYFHRQYNRKPARCHLTTVSGLTIASASRTPGRYPFIPLWGALDANINLKKRATVLPILDQGLVPLGLGLRGRRCRHAFMNRSDSNMSVVCHRSSRYKLI